MEEQVKKSNAGKILGIISFVIAIIALLVSVIPILGTIGIFVGIPAIILSIIALIIAIKGKGKKGLIITALILSFVANSVSGWQLYYEMNSISEIENSINSLEELNNIDTKSLEDELNDAMNESLDSMGGDVDKMQQGLDSVSGK
ncbi:MAG: hypothetical protein HY951_18825 [Bacteroidia bacterium]|nr:hypothetical protein [Bacteroidia bacterium]